MEKFSPKRQEKEIISLRLAVETLSKIDEKAERTGISRNEFINQCIAFALAHMDDDA